MQKHIRTEGVWRELTEHSQIYHKILNNRKEETDMSDFFDRKKFKKNRNTGETEMGSLWLFYTFFPWELLAHRRSISVKGAGEWQQQRSYLELLFLYPTFREIQKALRRKKPEKSPAGLNPMPRIPSHLKSLSRNWEKVQ